MRRYHITGGRTPSHKMISLLKSNPQWNSMLLKNVNNELGSLKKFKQVSEYKHLLLLRNIWWSKF